MISDREFDLNTLRNRTRSHRNNQGISTTHINIRNYRTQRNYQRRRRYTPRHNIRITRPRRNRTRTAGRTTTIGTQAEPRPDPEPPPRQRRPNRPRSTQYDESQGDDITVKNTDMLRIGCLNINSLPNDNNDSKNTVLRTAINEYEIDILGIQEANTDWHKLDISQRWDQRTRTWWEARHNSIAFNTADTERETIYQPGGTIITTINKATHRVSQDSGVDQHKLGRWAWTTFTSKGNIRTKVISGYRPCKSSTDGVNTTYTQHQRVFAAQKREICPRQAFLDDLGSQIDQWIETGEQIILLVDFNEDVRSNTITQWTEQHSLQNVFNAESIGNTAIPTYSRGSTPIDGIFCSWSIHAVKVGYCAFGLFPGDHRLLWLDITYRNAFGYNMAPPVTPQARRLKTSDPETLKQWIYIYTQEIQQHKVHSRIFNLETQWLASNSNTLPTQLQQEYESILDLRQKCIEIADRNCRKLHMSNIASSPFIKNLQDTIQLFAGALKRKKGVRFSLSFIKRLETKLSIYNTHLYTQNQIETKISEAHKLYNKHKPNSQRIRDTYLDRLADAHARDSDISKATMYRQLKQRENTRQSHRNIKYVTKQIEKTGMTKVVIITDDGPEELTGKQDIENACLAENEDKYHQTENTPCMQQPLRELLGPYGNGPLAQEILDGTFIPPPNICPYVLELFHKLQRVDIDPQDCPTAHISSTDFINGWKKIKEQTSASPGIHFGHMKASSRDTFLAQVESALANIPYSSGFSPKKWQSAVDVMIKKKINSELVTDLRTIVLCDCNFNYNNKTLGRTAMHHAVKHNLLAPEQYGSRPGKTAIEHALHKRLWYDQLRLLRAPGVLCSNDAKSCYDRVVHSIAALSFKRIGFPDEPVHSMFETIQNMQHHVRTSYGDSELHMDCSGNTKKYQGVLQGNGASPTTWALVSTPLLNMLRTANNGSHTQSSISREKLHVVGFAFVDDTDTPITHEDHHSTTIQIIAADAQNTLHRWEGGLKATGGALRPDKCCVFPISFTFNEKGDWRYETLDEMGVHFEVKDHRYVMETLTQKEAHECFETLGTWLSPDGNNLIQAEKLKDKSKEWAANVKAGFLNKSDAWRAINTTIIKSLTYPLPALTLSKKQCTSIMAPMLQVGLNAIGLTRNYPRALVHGSKKEHGLGIHDIYIEQGISYVHLIMKHLNADIITGKFICSSIEAATIEMGILGNLFDYDYKKYEHLLSDCWVKHAWKFMREEGIDIPQYVTSRIRKQRIGDVSIMETIVESNNYKPARLKKINRCRHFLQVNTLSEICTGYGTSLTKAYNCNKDETRRSPYIWPVQPRPSQVIIREWKKALRNEFLDDNKRITIQLGNFYKQEKKNWTWFINPNPPHNIFEHQNNRTRIWTRRFNSGRLGRTPQFKYLCETINAPPTLVPATINIINPNIIQLTGYYATNNRIFRTMKPPLLGDPSFLQLANPITPAQKQDIRNAIQAGTLNTVSDGSYYQGSNTGSAGWIIDNGTSIIIKITATTPGSVKAQGAYRSELFGLMCIILYIHSLFRFDEGVSGIIRIGCDGKGALSASNEVYDTVEPNRKHSDIILAIWNLLTRSPFTWDWYHIKGHQDDDTPFAALTREAQLNVIADNLAKDHNDKLVSGEIPHDNIMPWLPFQKHRLKHKGEYIHGEKSKEPDDTGHLREALQINKLGLSTGHYAAKASQDSPQPTAQKRWLGKWTSGFIGVGKMTKRYKWQTHSNCPRCQTEEEDTTHVLQCPQHDASELWRAEMVNIAGWCNDNKIAPSIRDHITANLNAWHNDDGTYPALPTAGDIRQAVQDQDMIGWRNFLDGYVSKKWNKVQQAFLQQERHKCKATTCLAKFQRRIWMIAWNMWSHRNKKLHETDHHEGHHQETQETEALIREEWALGLHDLPLQYSHLFSGTLEGKLGLSITDRRRWLASVWTAREIIEGNLFLLPTNTTTMRYRRWRSRFDSDTESEEDT